MGNSIFEDPDFLSQVILSGAPEACDESDAVAALRTVRQERQRLIRQASRINASLRQRRDDLDLRRDAVDRRSADLDQRERELRLWWAERHERFLATETRLQAEAETLRTQAAGLASWESQLHREQASLKATREEQQRRAQENSARLDGQVQAEAAVVAELDQRRAALDRREAELTALDAERAAGWEEAFARLDACRSQLGRQATGLVAWERKLAELFAVEVDLTTDPDDGTGVSAARGTGAEATNAAPQNALAANAARTATLIDEIQAWLVAALEDRAAARRNSGAEDRRRSQGAPQDDALGERLQTAVRNVVALIAAQRHEMAAWLARSHADLAKERVVEHRRWEVRQRTWRELEQRWHAFDPSHAAISGPAFMRTESHHDCASER